MDAQEEYRRRGERFAAPRVADLYRFRPPYSAEVLRVLLELIVDAPRGRGPASWLAPSSPTSIALTPWSRRRP